MNLLEKLEPVIIFSAIILGLLFSDIEFLKNNTSSLIIPFLFLMLLGIFLEVPLNDLKKSFHNFKFTGTSLIINFIWTPLFAYFLGSILLYNHIDIWIGFFMCLVTPCTDWYLLFTKMAKGDISLSLSILPINLVLQVILLPIYLLIFFGGYNTINLVDLIFSLIVIIVIPFVLSQGIKLSLNKNYSNKITSLFSNFQIVFLSIAIFAIFNSEGESLFNNLHAISTIFLPFVLFFTVNFIIDFYLSLKLKFSYKEYASLTLTTIARNSPLALAIAITSFPNNELIAMALVIGPLIELPVLYIVSKALLKIKKGYS